MSENGPVRVPAHPKRVVCLATLDGDFIALGVHLVGVDSYAKQDPLFAKQLEHVEVVTDSDLDKIMKLKPDLIVGLSNTNNVERLKAIAPVVLYKYDNHYDALKQFIEIGKLVGKEAEAKAWVAEFERQVQQAVDQIRKKIGAQSTVSVLGVDGKEMWAFGSNWGRGGEILYGLMHLKAPQAIEQTAMKQGYQQISEEAMPQFFGDYVFLNKWPGADMSFQQSPVYQNLPAVTQHHVYVVDESIFAFNDPLSLQYELKVIRKDLLGN